MFKNEYLDFLCCPNCRGNLEKKNKILFCKVCKTKYPLLGNVPILLPEKMAKDVKLSQIKWEEEYKKTVNKKKIDSLKKGFESTYLEANMKYFLRILKSKKVKNYLEIGSGPFFIGQELAKLGIFVVGIDYSLNSIKLAEYYLKKDGITNYLLVCGDIAKLPFKEDSFDLLYGGGAIEHFKDVLGVVKENYRVLKKGGVAFNTVPYLNLGSLTYRQVWGNIPYTPVLKNISEFVHINILKGKRMVYGYEYSFTKAQLRKIFNKAGFSKRNIEVQKFEVPLLFEYIPVKFLRNLAKLAANNVEWLWPGLYILSKK